MKTNHYEIYCRKTFGLPDNWYIYRYEALGMTHAQSAKVLRFEGIVCPLKTRGQGKGFPNYCAGDKTTRRECIVIVAEYEAWLKAWEQRTGLCAHCDGGEQVASCGVKGTTYRPCSECGGTGKARQ